MGLDIYAGTLTRYYSHNWKTVVQQWAEETDTLSTASPRTGNLLIRRKKCPRLRSRRRWRTGGIRS